jgi:hypothetical protein
MTGFANKEKLAHGVSSPEMRISSGHDGDPRIGFKAG